MIICFEFFHVFLIRLASLLFINIFCLYNDNNDNKNNKSNSNNSKSYLIGSFFIYFKERKKTSLIYEKVRKKK